MSPAVLHGLDTLPCPRGGGERLERIPVSNNIIQLSDSTFDETVGSASTPILVDFWAEWCGPCHMIAPILEELASEQAGKLTVAKVNVDENPNVALRFNVMSIPTLLLFTEGNASREVKRLVGAKGKSQLLADLSEYVA
jgi:thioredoxin 1